MFETISFQVTSINKVTHNSFILETDKGSVYLAHHEYVNSEVVRQVDLVVSCFYKGEKSPFSESFRGRPVSTLMRDGVLTATCSSCKLSSFKEDNLQGRLKSLEALCKDFNDVPELAYKVIKSLDLSQKVKYLLYLALKFALNTQTESNVPLHRVFGFYTYLSFDNIEDLKTYMQIQEYILQFV